MKPVPIVLSDMTARRLLRLLRLGFDPGSIIDGLVEAYVQRLGLEVDVMNPNWDSVLNSDIIPMTRKDAGR